MQDIKFEAPVDGRTTQTLLFNRATGAFASGVAIPLEEFPYRKDLYEAREVQIDFQNDYVDGGLIVNDDGTFTDDFTVRKNSDRPPVVYEYAINKSTVDEITDKYPISEQVNILIKSIEVLAKKLGVGTGEGEALESLGEMTDYIKLCLASGANKKEYYAAHPEVTYITDEALMAEVNARTEGVELTDLPNQPQSTGRIFKTDV